jgi:hypothetical protein
MGNGAVDVRVDAVAALETAAKAIYTVRIVRIGRLETLGSSGEIDGDAFAGLQAPAKAGGTDW